MTVRRLDILLGGLLLVGLAATAPAADSAAGPLPPAEAAATMRVPEGFRVELVAAEPDVCQPIACCLDDRGRLWVAEAYSYPDFQGNRGDRIVVLADRDGDGRAEERRVFFTGLDYVTGIEKGHGGVWVVSPPQLLFIPDRDGDDVPDGPPEPLLDGLGTHANAHNLANALAWGPDGWLYGTHGRTNWSLVGRPGAPEADRVRFDGGVYRYHPLRHEWEPYADGTTNPWGIDWDDHGEPFVSNCVDPHLFHVIRGAHYEPWRNRDSSRHAYERIATIADHLHFTGGRNVRQALGTAAEDAAGGGHAHCGTMIYLGDNWPAPYRGGVFMHNVHGRRINHDVLRRSGSGYVAAHAPDLMRTVDPWYMGVTLLYGPDGGVYTTDWSDTGECHSLVATKRETGRIYKILFGSPQPRLVDLGRASDLALAEYQLHANDYFVRHARRILAERAAAGAALGNARRFLESILAGHPDVTRRLRALWTLFACDAINADRLLGLLGDPDELVQAWAVRLLVDHGPVPPAVAVRLAELAETTASPRVRLHLASALQQLAVGDRWPLAAALLAHGEDADDANVPLVAWYGVEPLVEVDRDRFVALVAHARLPTVRRLGARRVVESGPLDAALPPLFAALRSVADDARRDLLVGILRGLDGRRPTAAPPGWRDTAAALAACDDDLVGALALELGLAWGDAAAAAALRGIAADRAAAEPRRIRAIETLAGRQVDDLAPLLLPLIDDPATAAAALRGLAAATGADTAAGILDRYPALAASLRADALVTLVARREWATALAEAVEEGRVPAADVDATLLRAVETLGDADLARRLRNAVAGPTEERTVAEYESLLATVLADERNPADRLAGRRLFTARCGGCHRLAGGGGEVGPDLTGSQRNDLAALVKNIVDPSAAVPRDWQMEVFALDSGRVVAGIVLEETAGSFTVRTLNEVVTLPRESVEERTRSRTSMMPAGLLDGLSHDELRDLFAYLMSAEQQP